MVDLSIRRNEKCIINLPRCDYVFNSARSCFVAYGFDTSSLELGILKSILKERDLEISEAGGQLTPGQYAFCTKICSKIIAAQFCVVLLNHDVRGGQEYPNANVNMEYGLMLGHNKYILPFQKEGQSLPFNVSGLDTVKYNNKNFEKVAAEAVDLALVATARTEDTKGQFERNVTEFLLSKNAVVATLTSYDERQVFELGMSCSFNLLSDFTGLKYIFLGNFTATRPNVILWRMGKLQDLIASRYNSLDERLRIGSIDSKQHELAQKLVHGFMMWILVTGESEKDVIENRLGKSDSFMPYEIFTLDDVAQELRNELGESR